LRRLGPLSAGVAVLLLALAAGSAPAGPARSASVSWASGYRVPDATLGREGQRRLRTEAWQGGTFTASTGEQVRVLVSDELADPSTIGQTWANFFASLLHGSELGVLTAYVVAPDQLASMCGPNALGCYGSNQLVMTDETLYGVTPQEVGMHEYGHHVASNRLNPPWSAVDWGPKRWASVANVCLRTQQGSAYPGDEDQHYTQNPGEAWAEVYRVVNQLRQGATTVDWPIVDGSFYPDATALQAAAEDVTNPWTAPVSQSYGGRFVRGGAKVWKLSVPTALDGSLAATLSLPPASFDELTVLTTNGQVLAKGLWSGVSTKQIAMTVCGQRQLVFRVVEKGAFGRFRLRVTHD
jgi:hypothetical protein